MIKYLILEIISIMGFIHYMKLNNSKVMILTAALALLFAYFIYDEAKNKKR